MQVASSHLKPIVVEPIGATATGATRAPNVGDEGDVAERAEALGNIGDCVSQLSTCHLSRTLSDT